MLYEADIRKSTALLVLEQRMSDLDFLVRDFTKELITGVEQHRRKIDELITTYSQGWDMDRMPVVDRNILRLAIYELLWSKDVPESVAIDEAIELAQTLSTDDSSQYINGVLGKILLIKPELAV